MHYDYLIVGTGLFGACFAYEMQRAYCREHLHGRKYGHPGT